MHPSLPISRLLLSLSDVDVGSFDIPQSWSLKNIIAMICFFPFSYVPYKIGEMIMLVMILIAWNGIIFGFYILGIYNYIAAISIGSIVCGIIFISVVFMSSYQYIKKSISTKLYKTDNKIHLFSFHDKNQLHSDHFFDMIDDNSLLEEIIPEMKIQKPYKSRSSSKYTDDRPVRYDLFQEKKKKKGRVNLTYDDEEKNTIDQEGCIDNTNVKTKNKQSRMHRRPRMKVPLVLNFTTTIEKPTNDDDNDVKGKKLSFYEQHLAFKNTLYDFTNTFTNNHVSDNMIKEKEVHNNNKIKHMKRKSKKEIPIAYGESSMKGQRLSWDDLNDINNPISVHDDKPDSDNDVVNYKLLSKRIKSSQDDRHRQHHHKKGVILPYLVDNEEAPLSFYSNDYDDNAAAVGGIFPNDGNIDLENFLAANGTTDASLLNGICSTDAVVTNFYDSSNISIADDQQQITIRNTMMNSFNSIEIEEETKMNQKNDEMVMMMMLTPSLIDQTAIFETTNQTTYHSNDMNVKHKLNTFTSYHNHEYKYSRRKLNSFRRKSPTMNSINNNEGPGKQKEDIFYDDHNNKNNNLLYLNFDSRKQISYVGPSSKKLPYIGPGHKDLTKVDPLQNTLRPTSSGTSGRKDLEYIGPGQRNFTDDGPGYRLNQFQHENQDYNPFDYMLTNIMLMGHDEHKIATAASEDFFFDKIEHNNNYNYNNNDFDIKLNTPMNQKDLHNQANERPNRYRNRVKGSLYRGYG